MMPVFDWSKSQDEWEFPLRIPVVQGDLGGEHVLTRGCIESSITEKAIDENRFVARANLLQDDQVSWCSSSDDLLCKFDEDGKTLVAVQVVDDETRKSLRTPLFIQNPERPMCCGRSMQFVGQIDDNDICMEPPPDATLWWHDAASFYVFTCAVCLECKAIGQQF